MVRSLRAVQPHELRSIFAAASDYEGILYLLQLMPTSEVQTWSGTEWVIAGRQSVYYDLFTGRKLQIMRSSTSLER